MNCLAWNCRGLGNAATVRDLCGLVKEANSQIVFLCETRQKVDRIQRIRNRLGLRGFTGVDSDGLSGGLALFWHESVYVEVKAMNERFIDTYIRISVDGPLWHATFVYGEPRVENRYKMWASLNSIKQSSNLPWVLIGDFNEALWQFEHFSIHPRGENQMQSFRDLLQTRELFDLGFSGTPYTYDNKRQGRSNVRVRLDRALTDNRWRDLFPDSQVVHLVSPRSDHCPVLLKLMLEDQQRRNRKKCLHYEICWERDASLPEMIQNSWEEVGSMADLGDVSKALQKVMRCLQSWSKAKFKNIGKELEKARNNLSALLLVNSDSAAIQRATDHMNELLYREEMLWLQRSRINWLKEGDRNTRFFHSKAVWRAKKNQIKSLRDADGTVYSMTTEMERLASNYFQEVYRADPNLDQSKVTSLFRTKVSVEMMLCKDFSADEISTALFQISPLKALGPDGFPARFFQRNWGVLKNEVVAAVQVFFQTGVMPDGINETAIVLIPKVNQPVELKDFRPISLCNVIYKVVSKCLVIV